MRPSSLAGADDFWVLADKFGDYGLMAVAMAGRGGDACASTRSR